MITASEALKLSARSRIDDIEHLILQAIEKGQTSCKIGAILNTEDRIVLLQYGFKIEKEYKSNGKQQIIVSWQG